MFRFEESKYTFFDYYLGTHTSTSEAQPNAKQKRYVVLRYLHKVFSILRHAIQPRRKERSSAK